MNKLPAVALAYIQAIERYCSLLGTKQAEPQTGQLALFGFEPVPETDTELEQARAALRQARHAFDKQYGYSKYRIKRG